MSLWTDLQNYTDEAGNHISRHKKRYAIGGVVILVCLVIILAVVLTRSSSSGPPSGENLCCIAPYNNFTATGNALSYDPLPEFAVNCPAERLNPNHTRAEPNWTLKGDMINKTDGTYLPVMLKPGMRLQDGDAVFYISAPGTKMELFKGIDYFFSEEADSESKLYADSWYGLVYGSPGKWNWKARPDKSSDSADGPVSNKLTLRVFADVNGKPRARLYSLTTDARYQLDWDSEDGWQNKDQKTFATTIL